MNRKEETLIAIVGMAIFATVLAASSSTQALASVDDTTNNGVASDGIDTSDSTREANDDLQTCLSENGVEELPTEQEVQDCMDPNSEGTDENDSTSENTDYDEDEYENTEDDDKGESDEEDEWE